MKLKQKLINLFLFLHRKIIFLDYNILKQPANLHIYQQIACNYNFFFFSKMMNDEHNITNHMNQIQIHKKWKFVEIYYCRVIDKTSNEMSLYFLGNGFRYQNGQKINKISLEIENTCCIQLSARNEHREHLVVMFLI